METTAARFTLFAAGVGHHVVVDGQTGNQYFIEPVLADRIYWIIRMEDNARFGGKYRTVRLAVEAISDQP